MNSNHSSKRLDVGIAIESDPDRIPTGLVFERLTDAEMVLIVPPKHPLSVREIADELLYRERQLPFDPEGFCEWGAKPQIKEFRKQ